jgi:uncharacterized Zn finger protein
MEAREFVERLEREEWRKNFDARTLTRAEIYVSEGRVSELEFEAFDEDTGFVAGRVNGSESEPYLATVTSTFGRHLKMDTQCECPVGIACKHVAALLLALERETREPPRRHSRHTRSDDPPQPGTDSVDLTAWDRLLD